MVLGQDAFQAGSRHLDRGHRLVDQLADARLLGGLIATGTQSSFRPDTRRSPGRGILGGPPNVHHLGLVSQ